MIITLERLSCPTCTELKSLSRNDPICSWRPLTTESLPSSIVLRSCISLYNKYILSCSGVNTQVILFITSYLSLEENDQVVLLGEFLLDDCHFTHRLLALVLRGEIQCLQSRGNYIIPNKRTRSVKTYNVR